MQPSKAISSTWPASTASWILRAVVSYTFRWEDPDPEDRETLVTLSLHAISGTSTELAFHQGDFATERRRALHEQGWTQSLNHLEELMAAPASS